MAEQEGVIKFELHHETADLPSGVDLTDLSHWRQELVRHGLVGRDPARYDGLGFGNLSQRLDIGGFVITGSQTGGLTKLAPEHFVWVSNVTTALNQVASQGRIYPSSEAITHATVYQASGEAMFVFHAHSPEIWAAGKALSLPATAFVPYGTPEMADEVAWLFAETDVADRGLFTMSGHEDGVVSFGATADQAGKRLLDALAAAREIKEPA